MAGSILERKLTPLHTGGVKFDVATEADDVEIRRLLRENPMPGRISISLEREPNYFVDAELPSEVKQTIVARHARRVICVGCCTIRQCFVNGKARRVGYLGGLRLDHRYSGRFDILRRGYGFFRELQTELPADYYFTSIASDNERARKFLEHGIPGLPHYEFVGEFVTGLVSSRSSGRMPRSELVERPISVTELASFLNEYNCTRQFAPCWSVNHLEAFQKLGLQSSDFSVLWSGQKLIACGVLWDQRNYKQTVIRGYAPFLTLARPLFNAFARFTNHPRLPAIGETLASGFMSPIAIAAREEDKVGNLVEQVLVMAHRRGLKFLTLGFAANDHCLTAMRKIFRFREYQSLLYVVRWPKVGGAASELDGRLIGPDVALL